MINKTGTIPFLLAPILSIIILPGLAISIVINELVRFVVSKLLVLKYKNKVNLISDGDGFWGYKKEFSTRNVIVYIVTEGGKLDPKRIAKHYNEKIKAYTDSISGTRPYEKFEKIMTKKFGYFCWEDGAQAFDIRNHIRVMKQNKLYSQEDICNLSSELIKDMDESKPQWELIIFPRYNDDRGQERSILMIRFQHGFMDGLSVVMLFKELVCINSKYSIDPLTFQIPYWKKALFYMGALIYGPFFCFTTFLDKFFLKPWILRDGNLPRTKYFTWTKPVSSEMVRQVRMTADKASVTNVIATAFVTSAAKVLPKSRLVSEALISEVFAFLPYPNLHPRNRFAYFTYGIPTEGDTKSDSLDNLRQCKRDSLISMMGPEPLMTYYMLKTLGRFPSFMFSFFISGATASVLLSNVPFSKSNCSFKDGNEVLEVGAWTPHPNDLGISVTSVSYGDEIKISGCGDSSWLSREELCQIIDGIPKEIEAMAGMCSSTISKADDMDKIMQLQPDTEQALRSR